MGASEELEYLKSLVAKLSDKIRALESKTSAGSPTPAEQLRTILMGPPGAGTSVADTYMWRVVESSTREGYSGTQDKGRVLRLPSGHRRHA
jgi:hypothetical protein